MALLSREQIEVLISAKNQTDRAIQGARANLKSLADDAAIAAAAVGAIGIAIGKVMSNVADTAITAELLGLNADQLRDLQAQARAFAGVTDQQFNTAIQRMVRRLGDAIRGNETWAKSFEAVGISIDNLDPDLTTATLLEQVADGIRNLDSAAEQLSATQAIFDTEGVKMVQLFRTAPEDLRNFTNTIRSYGTITKEAEDRSRDFRVQLETMKEAFTRTGETLVLDFLEPWEEAPTRISIIALGIQREFLEMKADILALLGSGFVPAGAGVTGIILSRLFGNPGEFAAASAEARAAIADVSAQIAILREGLIPPETGEGGEGGPAGGQPGDFLKTLVGTPEANQALFDETERLATLHFERMLEAESKAIDRANRAREREKDVENRSRDQRLQSSRNFFTSSLAMASSNSRGLFNIWKASAIAQAIVSTHQAASNALADVRPFPLNLAAAAAITAAGLARVASIRATSFSGGGGGGGGGGGFTGGGGFGGNEALPPPIVAQPTASSQQQQAVELIIKGGDAFGRMVVDALEEEVNNRDAVIIRTDSRQAEELRS